MAVEIRDIRMLVGGFGGGKVVARKIKSEPCHEGGCRRTGRTVTTMVKPKREQKNQKKPKDGELRGGRASNKGETGISMRLGGVLEPQG